MSDTIAKLEFLNETKQAIKAALIEKGQTVADTDTFRSYAEKIAAIETSADPVLGELVITENGTYLPGEGLDGYSSVTVNVAGASTDVCYVTFMSEDGATELYKRAVVPGNHCGDVIALGLLEEQTKEPTDTEVFTRSGWSLTAGGEADDSALLNVTEDRTVYAAFEASTRYYTITYLDDDGVTVLHTEQLPYGATPTYSPATKEGGYVFAGWTTTVVSVTEDAVYTAQWILNPLIADSWEEIIASVSDGSYATKYAVGQYKELSFGTEGTVRMQIAAIDDSNKTLADGSGNPAITWSAMELLATTHAMNSVSGNKTLGTGNYGGWAYTEMRTYLNSTVIALLPDIVKDNIKPIKQSLSGYDANNAFVAFDSEDSLWLMGGSDYADIFPTADARIRCKNGTETATAYWTAQARSYYLNSQKGMYFYTFDAAGNLGYENSSSRLGVPPCFCF